MKGLAFAALIALAGTALAAPGPGPWCPEDANVFNETLTMDSAGRYVVADLDGGTITICVPETEDVARCGPETTLEFQGDEVYEMGYRGVGRLAFTRCQ